MDDADLMRIFIFVCVAVFFLVAWIGRKGEF